MSTMMKLNNNRFIILLQDYLYALHFKDIMLLFLLMGKLELARLLPCKVLNIIYMIMKEELFPELFKISSNIYKDVKINKQNLWLELLIYKFIMKSLVIY
jgi:hypothetical protein